MSAPLPERLDPRRAVVASEHYRGELPLAALPRLAAMLEPSASDSADQVPAAMLEPSASNSADQVPAGLLEAAPADSADPQPHASAASMEHVTYDLAFGRDGAGRATVTGRVQALLPLRCERCAEPMALPVDAELRLALVEGLDEAAALPESHDPLLLAPTSDSRPDVRLIAPRDLIEDELILAIPVVVRHPDGLCPVDWSGLVNTAAVSATGAAEAATGPADIATPQRPNPFAALAALKDGQAEP